MYEHRDASKRLTFDFDEIDSFHYPSVTRVVVEQFQLIPVGELVVGPGERFQDYQRDGKIVGLEWDYWSGYKVVATTKSAEKLVRNIAEYLELHF